MDREQVIAALARLAASMEASLSQVPEGEMHDGIAHVATTAYLVAYALQHPHAGQVVDDGASVGQYL